MATHMTLHSQGVKFTASHQKGQITIEWTCPSTGYSVPIAILERNSMQFRVLADTGDHAQAVSRVMNRAGSLFRV